MFNYIVTDAHGDIPADFNQSQIFPQHMQLYKGYVQFFACYTEDKTNPFSDILLQIERLKAYCENHPMQIVTNYTDLEKAIAQGQSAIILCIENCAGLSLANLHTAYAQGVRLITLTWNHQNEIAGGSESDGGLTPYGREFIKTAQELGMMLDLAHLNKASFYEVYDALQRPGLVTHAGAHGIYPHPRNIDDRQYRLLCDTDSFCGVPCYPLFLNGTQTADSADIAQHICHFSNINPYCVGIGSDFNGIAYTTSDIHHAGHLYKLAQILPNYGNVPWFSQRAMGENCLKYLKMNFN